ncbi:FecCD family ABC transporter permease [Cohnella fermenti]|uniref:Iron ABC transporter permease n=1 Tax=Cohnella fermenti TaxID=2565925 RepID=A0A4S4C673_9BACL|nr:iron ABC transporter permease [Cohnella fermenti]THF83285.1 iron ABC transporter permease [Cohnella fermenti]
MQALSPSPEERRRQRRSIALLVVLGALVFVVFLLAMNTGSIRLSPLQVLRTLAGEGNAKQELILYEFRLPRIVIAVLIGAGLSVSGCVLQGISRNALADPGILGINAGAGLAVMLFISFYPGTEAVHVFALPALALAGALLTAALIYSLAYKRYEGLSPTRLLFNGIGVASGIGSAMILLTLRLSPEKFQVVASWLAGSIWGTDWRFVLALLPWVAVLLPFVICKAQTMNVLGLGEQTAAGLGVTVAREQFKLLLAAVALAGSCVAVSGGIGFVGLLGPHMAKRLVGSRHQILLPTAALLGSLLVLAADTAGRWIVAPSELPAGIVVAVLGAPYFLYLLARSR